MQKKLAFAFRGLLIEGTGYYEDSSYSAPSSWSWDTVKVSVEDQEEFSSWNDEEMTVEQAAETWSRKISNAALDEYRNEE